MKALVVGYNAWDVVVPCDELPRRDAKREYSAIHHGGGGPGATAAVALARLGVRTSYAGVIADDGPGSWQRQELAGAGVDLSHAVTEVGGRSAQAVILVDPATAERRICWSRGDLRHLEAGEVPTEALDGVDLLLIDGHEPAATELLTLDAARRGIPVIYDGGTPRAGSADLVAAASDVIGAEGFAPGLTGVEDPLGALEAMMRMGPRLVATTFGAAGCVTLRDGAPVHVPAFDLPVVDTTGAGDAFHAGYAWGLLRGDDPLAALTTASAVAALGCRGWGGRSALPDADEADDLIRHGRRRDLPSPIPVS